MNLCRERLNAIEQLQLLVLHLEERGPLPSGELIQPRVHGGHVQLCPQVDRVVGLRP